MESSRDSLGSLSMVCGFIRPSPLVVNVERISCSTLEPSSSTDLRVTGVAVKFFLSLSSYMLIAFVCDADLGS